MTKLPTVGRVSFMVNPDYEPPEKSRPIRSRRSRRQRDRLPGRERPSFPPARQNGLVANNGHFTEYKQVGRTLLAVSPDDRNGHSNRPHYQSLPNSSSNNKLAEENHRQTNSAPHRPRHRRPDIPRHLPKLNNLVKNHKTEPLQALPPAPFNNYRTGPTAGRATRDGEVKNLKSNKFATSWADARAGRITADASPTREESPRAREVPTGSPARSPVAKSVATNASRMNGKSPQARSPEKDQTKSPSVDSIKDTQTRRVNQKKVVQGKPKIDTKTVKPMRKQTITHMEIPNAGELKRNKTLYMEKDEDQLPAEDQEKLQKSVYGVSQFRKIYNSKTSLSRRDIDSRAQTNPSQMEKPQNPYLQEKVKTTPPWRRGEYILTKNETKTYKSIKKVYDNKLYKKQRQERFLKKLGDVQEGEIRKYNENAKEAMLRKIQTKIQQQMQLQRIRERFEEDQSKRFRTQYVTIRQLKHESEDRQVYGLPDDLNKPVEHRAKLKRKKPQFKTYEVHGEDDVREKNRRKYEKIFDVKTGPKLVDPNAKPPKMEGIDTVDLDEPGDETDGGRKTGAKVSVTGRSARPSRVTSQAQGNIDKKRPKKADVKDVLADAKKVLEQQKDDDESPRSPRKTNVTKGAKPTTTAPSRGKASNDTSGSPDKTKAASPEPKKEEIQKIDDDLDSLDLDDDDDDDDDIFEKARRKYNINLDSDDDD